MLADRAELVEIATRGRRMSADETANTTRDVRTMLLTAGLAEADAARISTRIASATSWFADACSSANRAARELSASFAEMADALAERNTRNDGA